MQATLMASNDHRQTELSSLLSTEEIAHKLQVFRNDKSEKLIKI